MLRRRKSCTAARKSDRQLFSHALPVNRVVGIETEYGCLVTADSSQSGSEPWPNRVRNFAFKNAKLGALDQHYRDYEEPPGNGGFLLNGGRLYMDMGHLEYSTPECRSLADAVSYQLAGDLILQSILDQLGAADHVAFIKNNIDHHTGATFGCHENYLMKRQLEFQPRILGTLLAFLATRQIFTGTGRVGQATAPGHESHRESNPVKFQLSQRADHIVNDLYQWVQFNRAIINARDEPLADHQKYRRLHLLIGDSNVSPFACALKLGTTALILTLLEEGTLTPDVILHDAVTATRQISHKGTGRGAVSLEDGRTRDALDIQDAFQFHAQEHLGGRDPETDGILKQWAYTLQALRHHPEQLIGGVDWMSKKWLLDIFRESEGLNWEDPWLQSLDLEYHNINPAKGLFFALNPSDLIRKFNRKARQPAAMRRPPPDTRAHGRGLAAALLKTQPRSYVINWDSVTVDNHHVLSMPDPFETYDADIRALFPEPLPSPS